MSIDVFGLSHNFQILWTVIFFIAIDVMDDFAFMQRASNYFFSNNTMLMASVFLCIGKT